VEKEDFEEEESLNSLKRAHLELDISHLVVRLLNEQNSLLKERKEKKEKEEKEKKEKEANEKEQKEKKEKETKEK
jgi:hypothetical protein